MSIADTTGKSDLQKGTIYNHFNDNKDILFKAIDKLTSQFGTNVLSFAYDERLSPHIRLKKIMNTIETIYFLKKVCELDNLPLEVANIVSKIKQIIYELFNGYIICCELPY